MSKGGKVRSVVRHMAFPTRFGFPSVSMPAFLPAGYPATVQMVPVVASHYTVPVIPTAGVLTSMGAKQMRRKPEPPPEKHPVTTVFVGNITERASNDLVKSLLQKCGPVINWKRIQGSNGKYQAFGFCEYEHPESTLRALRLLHDWQLGDRKLVVKADEKTRKVLIEYINKKRSGKGLSPKNVDGDVIPPPDDETFREDQVYLSGIQKIVSQHKATLEPEEGEITAVSDANYSSKRGNLDEMNMDQNRREYIEREINFFRETYKDDKETIKRPKNRADERGGSPRGGSREREPSEIALPAEPRGTPQIPPPARPHAHRTRGGSPHSSASSGGNSPSAKHKRRSSLSPSPNRARERDHRSRSRRSPTRSSVDDADDDETYEKKRLERKLREKEAAYQERLRKWEIRERKRSKDYEKLKIKEKLRRKEEMHEAKKLKEFLEDYEDERDDPKYYKGSALLARRREFDKEKENDARDRLREKEELDEIRQKLVTEGHADPDVEIQRLQAEQDASLRERLRNSESASPAPNVFQKEGSSDSGQPTRSRSASRPMGELENVGRAEAALFRPAPPGTEGRVEMKPIGFAGIKIGGSTASKMNVKLFGEDDDADDQKRPQRKLVPIEYSEEEERALNRPLNSEEKKKMIKELIEKIPTSKDDLFRYPINWSHVDASLIEKRLKPWVNKKISEYIGEEELSLVDFICQKVVNKTEPHVILEDVAMILDEEAEVFVVKMWRLLIYELEAKRLGLLKSDEPINT